MSEDKEEVLYPIAIIPKKPITPFNNKKIPLDDRHTCPMCDGKGFVHIVEESSPRPVRPAIRRWPKT